MLTCTGLYTFAGITVYSGGAAMTGNSSIAGTLNTGAVTVSSGNLNVSSSSATISGTLNCGALTAVGNSVFSGSFLTTQAIYATQLTASGQITNSAGGLSVIGTRPIAWVLALVPLSLLRMYGYAALAVQLASSPASLTLVPDVY